MALTQISTGGIKDDAVTDAKLPANSVGNSEMKDDAVGVAELSATGTASSSTFLRGDNSWVTPTDTNTQRAFANDANNRVVTGDGSGGLNGEANLTFNGTKLTLSGVSSADPIVEFINTSASANEGEVLKLRASGRGGGVDDIDVFKITNDSDSRTFGVSNAGTINTTGNIVIASGKGIDFSANSHATGMTSEVLDSYEEGTFTPTIKSSASTTGQTDGTGSYTKIGNVVHAKICFANKSLTNIPNGDFCEIAGLPFNAVHDTHSDEMAISGPMVEMGIAQRNGGIFRTTNNTNYLRAYYMQNNSTWATWYVDDFNNSGVYLIFGITYFNS